MRQVFQNSIMAAAVLFLLSACAVKMVSDYDSRTEASVSTLRTQLTSLFFELAEERDEQSLCSYENHSDQYKAMRVELDVMAMRERSKAKNDKTIDMVEVFDTALKKLQKTHQRGCLKQFQIDQINQTLSKMLDSILRVEVAKLRGASKPFAQTTER